MISASRSAPRSVRSRVESGGSGRWATPHRAATCSRAWRRSRACSAARAFARPVGSASRPRSPTTPRSASTPERMTYPRDLIGYGRPPPDPKWPGQARLALQIVVNYEEGGERSILHGDTESEAFLQEVVGAEPLRGVRNLQVESVYEYGSRAGFWRLMRLFAERGITVSFFAVAMALERHPEAARAIVEAGHEAVSHGWRWIDYQFVSEAVEREHIRLAVESLTKATGRRPLGWYTGRLSPDTRPRLG